MKRALAGILFLAAAARAEVRVALFQKELPAVVEVLTPALVEDQETAPLRVVVEDGEVVLTDGRGRARRGAEVSVQPAGLPLRLKTPKSEARDYAGRLVFSVEAGRLLAVNHVEDEEYLASTLTHELPGGWPADALRAQAVVSRTFTARRGRHRPYDFCDLAHCQVYGGKVSPASRRALAETAGLVLVREGVLAAAYFHAACGGHTAWPEDVWGGGPGLAGVPDSPAYCEAAPTFRWKAEITPWELALIVDEENGPIQDMRVRQTDRSGRARTIQWKNNRGPGTGPGEKLYLDWGRRRGWHELRSTRFTVARLGENFIFEGTGLGHGVGLCQYGARGRALAGFGYREILRHYFPGAEIKKIARG